MNIEQINQALLAKFDESRLVFWHDTDSEFQQNLDEIKTVLNGFAIETIELDDASHFEVKQRIELTAPTQKFLLYSVKAPGERTRDWLFDIRLYAQTFYADASAIILNELGMRLEFRQDIIHHKLFFAQSDNYQKLKKLLPQDADKPLLQLAMLAVLSEVDSLSFVSVMQKIVAAYHVKPSKAENLVNRFADHDLERRFWLLCLDHFGYMAKSVWMNDEQAPSIRDLLLKLLVTDCYQGLNSSGVAVSTTVFGQSLSPHLLPVSIDKKVLADVPEDYRAFLGNFAAKRAGVVGFVSAWRESRTLAASYNAISGDFAQLLEIKHKIAEFNHPEQLLSVETFIECEQQLLRLLATDIRRFTSQEVNDWVSIRLRGHWCAADDNYSRIYKALRAAKQLYSLKEAFIDGFEFATAKALHQAYEQKLYQFDFAYRVFCENAIEISKSGSEILKATGLIEEIEQLYVDWYLHDLAIAWGKLVDAENLLNNWQLPGVSNQQQFYRKEVKGVLSRAKRVVVIISDAYRYECAKELAETINNGKTLKAELSSQLGVVPSYTQAGMAALLPHQEICAKLNQYVEYQVDGIAAYSTANRDKILKAHNGMALTYEKVMEYSKPEFDQLTEDASVVYIYHNKIDAIGDDGAKQNDTFSAARAANNELEKLIRQIITRYKIGRVIVTADHGFLFHQSDVKATDRAVLKAKPEGTKLSKKRYLIGQNLPSGDNYWVGRMSNTAGVSAQSDAEFIISRGSNRFHFVGGAKFIHGGIMPQEIVVPVMHIRAVHSKVKDKLTKAKVQVIPLHNPIKIVSNIDSVEFLQTDAVGEHFVPREFNLWIENPAGDKVSATTKAIFDSASTVMEQRKRNIQIKLEGAGFNRAIDYKLIMEDTDNETKTTHSVIIDLAFEDDFF